MPNLIEIFRERIGDLKPVLIRFIYYIRKNRRRLLPFFSGALIILIPVIFFGIKNAMKVEAAWFDDKWKYRKPITISYTGTSSLTNFQVEIAGALTSGCLSGKANIDGSDLRFTTLNGQLIDYWIEDSSNTDDVTNCSVTAYDVWVEVPTIPVGGATIYMYYGNPTALPYSDGDATFTFFDDFRGAAINGSKWGTATGTITVSGGNFTVVPTSAAWQGLWSASSFGSSIVEGKIKLAINVVDHVFGFGDAAYATQYALVGYYGTVDEGFFTRNATSTQYTDSAYDSGNWNDYKVEMVTSTSVKYYEDDNLLATHTTYPPTASIPVTITAYNTATNNADWVFVRQYAATTPGAPSVGSEEQTTEPYSYYNFDEGTGTTTYDQMKIANGTISNAVWNTNGVLGKSLTFDGSGDYVKLSNDQEYGDGADGSMTLAASKNINTQVVGSGRTAPDGEFFVVSSITENSVIVSGSGSGGTLGANIGNSFLFGDEILLINERGDNTNFGNVGNYEFLTVGSAASSTISFTTNIQKIYGATTNNFNLTGQQIIVQRVPNYTDVTIDSGQTLSASAWSGTAGGIIAFRANSTVTVNGSINVASSGYRGGYIEGSGPSSTFMGQGGEAFCGAGGLPGFSSVGSSGAAGGGGSYSGYAGGRGICGGGGGAGWGAVAVGGSGPTNYGGSGGGGGYAGAGGGGGYGSWGTGGMNYTTGVRASSGGENSSGNGGNSTAVIGGGGGGGGSFGFANLSKLYLGAGGGRGSGNNGVNFSGIGGNGGGTLFISANTLIVLGSITSSGANGGNAGTVGAGGGGGAGGSIKILGKTVNMGASVISATGGTGGTSGGWTSVLGGDAGIGRIAVSYQNLPSGTAPTGTTFYDSGAPVDYGDLFSASLWFRQTGTIAETKYLLSKFSGKGFKFYMKSDGTVCVGVDDDSTFNPDEEQCSTTTYKDSKWHHAVFLVDNDGLAKSMSIYIDNVRVANVGSLSTGTIANTGYTYAGIDSDASSNSWQGQIDELKLYKSVNISTTKIKEEFNRGAVAVGKENDPTGFEISDGLVGYWKLDESSGDASDSSGNGVTLTNNGTTTYVAGKFGKAASLNGSSQYFSTSTAISGVQTVSFWVKPTASGTYTYVDLNGTNKIKSSSGIITANGSAGIFVNGVRTTSISSGVWSFVLVTYGSGITTSNLKIGYDDTDYLAGLLDDVRFYSKEWSTNNAQSLYYKGGDPLVDLDFNEGSGINLVDKSGNGYDAVTYVASGYTDGPATITWTGYGKYGSAINFSGSNQYAKISNAVLPSAGFAISAWVKPDDVSKDMVIAGRKDAYSLRVAGGKASFGLDTVENLLDGVNGIVDVFYYDTTKDSVSTSWRFDSTKSWYTETKDATCSTISNFTTAGGSADRCGSSEFPEKALIATTSSSLYVYDAENNSPWMRFDTGGGTAPASMNLVGNDTQITSVYGLNGKVYLSGRTLTGWGVPLGDIDFTADDAYRYYKFTTASGWYDLNWNYRMPIQVTSPSAQTDYDVLISIGTSGPIAASKMQSDCDDVRVTDNDGSTLIDYWIEGGCNTDSTQLWARVPSVPNGTKYVYVYYGNAGAPSAEKEWSGEFITLDDDGTCGVGWTSDTNFNGNYPYGSTQYGATGGSAHNHTTTYCSGSTDAVTSCIYSKFNAAYQGLCRNHAHDATPLYASGFSSYTPNPSHWNMAFCKKSKLDVTTNTIVMFDIAAPSGWTRFSNLDSRFPYGATSSYGTGAGDATHNHTVSVGGTSGMWGVDEFGAYGAGATPTTNSHTHSASSGAVGNASTTHLPPYLTMVFASADAGTTKGAAHMIVMINSGTAPPLGWTRFSALDSKFPYGGSSYGATGGNTTHNHTVYIYTGVANQQISAVVSSTPATYTANLKNHTHYCTGTTNSPTNANIPAYLGVVYVERNTPVTTTVETSEEDGAGSLDHYNWKTDISERNSGVGYSQHAPLNIINNGANDVSVQKIGSNTYVAGATEGGISVVNETTSTDYDYSDVTDDDYNSVSLTSGGELYALNESQGQLEKWNNIHSDSAPETNGTPDKIWDEASAPALTASAPTINTAPSNLWVISGNSMVDGTSDQIFVGTNLGATVVNDKAADESNGSVKYITKDFVSEEMIGDIRGMWPMVGSGSIANTDTSADASIKAHTLTATLSGTGTMSYASGVRGTGITMSGSTGNSSYLTSNGDSADYNLTSSDVTMGTWIKTTQTAMATTYVIRQSTSPGNDYFLICVNGTTANKACFYTGGAIAIVSNTSINDGNWHFVVGISRNSGNTDLYIDGKLEATSALARIITNANKEVRFGNNIGADQPYVGSIDEPFVTAEALSATQVSQMYETGRLALLNDSASDNDANKLSGASNTVQAIAASPIKNSVFTQGSPAMVFAGTDTGGVTQFDLASDTQYKIYTASTTPAIKDENIKSIAPFNAFSFAAAINDTNDAVSKLNDVSGDSGLSTGVYTHVMGVFDDDAEKMYVYENGVLTGSGTLSSGTTAPSNSNKFVIAAAQEDDYYTGFFDGKIDELKVFSYVPAQKNVAIEYSTDRMPDPVIWYKFDKGWGTTITNEISGTYPATLSGTTWKGEGKFGKALSYNGSSSYVYTSNAALISGNGNAYTGFSISAWVKPVTIAASKTILHKNNEFRLTTDADSKPQCEIYSGGSWQTAAISSIALSLNTWQHVMCVYDGVILKVFVDGRQLGGTSLSSSITSTNTTALNIGRDSGGSGYFQGLIDEVRVFDYNLTASEANEEFNRYAAMQVGKNVFDLRNSGDASVGSAPVSWWKFDEGSGTTTYDNSDNANNGTLGTGASSPAWNGLGKFGSALTFTSSQNDYVDMGDSNIWDFGAGDFSLMAWIKSSTANANQTLIGKDDDGANKRQFFLSLRSTNLIHVGYFVGATQPYLWSATGIITDTNWHHVVGQRTGNAFQIYLDGNNIASGTTDGAHGTMNSTVSHLWVGQREYSGANFPFSGLIDDVRIYNYARSARQVLNDMFGDTNVVHPVGLWAFGEGEGQSARSSHLDKLKLTNTTLNLTMGSSPSETYRDPSWDTTESNCHMGYCLLFSGTSPGDYVYLPATGPTINAVSFWINPVTTTETVMDFDGGTHKITITAGTLSAVGFSAPTIYINGLVSTSISAGSWSHVMATSDQSFSTTKIEFGRSGSVYFNGRLDEIAIFNYPLTVSDNKELYNDGAARYK